MKTKKCLVNFLFIFVFMVIFQLQTFGASNAKKSGKISQAPGSIRFVMAVGANDGGASRHTLQYAVSDARAFLEVLYRMGGVDRNNSILTVNPGRLVFLSALREFNSNILSAKKEFQRVESIFYYSGHSDEEGILLGNEKVMYTEIRREIDSLAADVRIAILDSCSSGAFTLAKGGKMRSPFLVDSSNDMRGFAFMTSSSRDEASQESETLKSSFFTHYLVSGLRGAADTTLDKKITLNEIYQYAYHETLSRTEKTLNGPQHPNYFIQMAGTGDVILTDLRKSSSGIYLSKNMSGRISVRDSEGILVGEFKKPFGADMEIAVEPGHYTVLNENDNSIYETKIVLQQGDRQTLKAHDFTIGQKESTVSRGNITGEPNNNNNNNTNSNFLVSLEKVHYSGYGSPFVRFAGINNSFAVFTGGRGAAIINNSFSIGGAGYGMVTPILDSTGYEYSMGCGGMLLEYYFLPKNLISFSIGAIIGAGSVRKNINADLATSVVLALSSESQDTFDFFMLEPEINVYVNITRNIRLGIGASYRIMSDFNAGILTQDNFRGFSGGIFVEFGKF